MKSFSLITLKMSSGVTIKCKKHFCTIHESTDYPLFSKKFLNILLKVVVILINELGPM